MLAIYHDHNSHPTTHTHTHPAASPTHKRIDHGTFSIKQKTRSENGVFRNLHDSPFSDKFVGQDHSLRGLYGASHFAETAASLFAALYRRFDFQGDNVRR